MKFRTPKTKITRKNQNDVIDEVYNSYRNFIDESIDSENIGASRAPDKSNKEIFRQLVKSTQKQISEEWQESRPSGKAKKASIKDALDWLGRSELFQPRETRLRRNMLKGLYGNRFGKASEQWKEWREKTGWKGHWYDGDLFAKVKGTDLNRFWYIGQGRYRYVGRDGKVWILELDVDEKGYNKGKLRFRPADSSELNEWNRDKAMSKSGRSVSYGTK